MTTTGPRFGPWDRRTVEPAISLEDAARRARLFGRIEQRLGDALSAWSEVVPEAYLRELLVRHADHHRWHASLWAGTLAGEAANGAQVVESPAMVAVLDAALGAPADPAGTLELLTAVYRVLLPRKIAAYTYYLRALGSAEAATAGRWIEFVLRDEHDGVRDGELALQRMLGAPGAVARAADHRAALETLLLRADGLVGPGTLGGAEKEATSP